MSESTKDDVVAGEVTMTQETLNQDGRSGSPIASNYSKSSEFSVSETSESEPQIPVQNDIQMMLNDFNQKIEENDRSIKRIEESITALYGRLDKTHNGETTTSSQKKMNKKEDKKQKQKKMNKKEDKKQKQKKMNKKEDKKQKQKKMNKKEDKKKGKGSISSKGITKSEKKKSKKLRTKTNNINVREKNKGKNK
jgi:hypothetical protein